MMIKKLMVKMLLGTLVLGLVNIAIAEYLTSDGDLGMQQNGVTLTSPWSPVAGATGINVNSPFTNVFADNGMAIHEGTGSPYYAQSFTPVAASATGLLYMNMDAQIKGSGRFNLVVDDGTFFNGRTLALYFAYDVPSNNHFIWAESAAGKGDPILDLELDVWYNIQLTLDLDTDTYSGIITREGTLVKSLISSRSFVQDKVIANFYSDSNVPGIGITNGVDHETDNIVISTTPVPEPITMSILAFGAALTLARRKK